MCFVLKVTKMKYRESNHALSTGHRIRKIDLHGFVDRGHGYASRASVECRMPL